jgi:hypothetical protein
MLIDSFMRTNICDSFLNVQQRLSLSQRVVLVHAEAESIRLLQQCEAPFYYLLGFHGSFIPSVAFCQSVS